jgi:hypothetical protein
MSGRNYRVSGGALARDRADFRRSIGILLQMARLSGAGRMYITRLRPAVDPVSAEYLLTFGSGRSSEIALRLGSVRGLDTLTDVFRAGHVPVREIERAWRVLATETHYMVRVSLTRELLRMLNLH